MPDHIFMALYLMAYYGVSDGKVFDIHFRSSKEQQMEANIERDRENQKCKEVVDSEEASEKEKRQALVTLQDNGKFG